MSGHQDLEGDGDCPRNLQDVRIDHRCLQAAVAEQELDGSDVGTAIQQVSDKTVPQAMSVRVFADLATLDDLFEGPLRGRALGMPAHPAPSLAPAGATSPMEKHTARGRLPKPKGIYVQALPASGLASPPPRGESSRCSAATRNKCCCSGDTRPSGKTLCDP